MTCCRPGNRRRGPRSLVYLVGRITPSWVVLSATAHLLYSAVPLPAAPISAASPRVLSPMAPPTEADEPMSADPSTSVPAMPTTQTDSSETQYQPLSGTIDDEAAPEDADMQDVEPEAPAAPTTRSKTLPRRRPPTPTPPPVEVNLGVMTLSDVLTARDVLAEKANAHWIKGLGGGQNKESETIVNFLYKMKVGPGRSTLTPRLFRA